MTLDSYTYCPGCNSRILPGHNVIGVDHEDPFMALWHTGCRKLAEYRAGHAERMKVAQAQVDENLRKHAESVAREAIRGQLVARIEAHGAKVHDGNCCENERIDFGGAEDNAGSMSLEDFEHSSDPGLLVLERDGKVMR